MVDQEHDWLDERLAESPYIADAGFTERVVHHLPQMAQKEAGRARRRILTIAMGISFALGLFLGIHDGLVPAHAMTSQIDAGVVTHVANQLTELFRQPVILYAGAAVMTVSSFAILPFLRRWV